MRRFILSLSIAIAACSSATLKSPKSDNNFDDSDDPGQNMMGTLPDASDVAVSDAEGKSCAASAECPAPLRCIFPIALGCGIKGQCARFTDPPGCMTSIACGCDDKPVALCSPDGFSPAPVKYKGNCAAIDGATD